VAASNAIDDAVERFAHDEIAVDGLDRALTGRELREAVAAEAAWLASLGVQRCALAADNGVSWVVADLALYRRRIPALPLPLVFTATQRAHAMNDAGIDSVLVEPGLPPLAGCEDWTRVGSSPVTGLDLYRRALSDRPALPDGTVKITYTSGSTGAPKGVCLSARNLEAVGASLVDATSSLELKRHLCLLPMSTLLENVAGVYAPLISGTSTVVPSMRTTGVGADIVEAPRLLRTIASSGPDSAILVPELLRLLVAAAAANWTPPSTLRFLAVGGATVAPALLERAEALGLPVYEGYGLSECGSVVCLNTPRARRLGSVGRVLPHAQLRVDMHGEIRVSGQVMLGYVGQPQRHPVDEYATGDLGDVDADGYVYVRGRERNVFITSMGRNVSPEWPESELVSEPAIAQAFVHGEARPYPIALIVPSQPDVDAIVIQRAVEAANARLPCYARVHRWLRVTMPFSATNQLLTANGRLRRDAIERRYATQVADLYVDAIAS